MTLTDEQLQVAIEEAVGVEYDHVRARLPRTFAALQRRMTDPVEATVRVLTDGAAYEALKAATDDETDARRIAAVVGQVVSAAMPQLMALLA